MAPAFGGQIPICMRCGERDIRQQSSGDGLWPAGGEGVAWVCDTCGHIGAPFLVDPADSGTMEARWDAELARTAHEIEDEPWRRAGAPDTPRGVGFGLAFVAVGALFLIPGTSAFLEALQTLRLWPVVRAVVGNGWLTAIGLVLVLFGVRRLRAPPNTPGPPRGAA